MENKDKLVIIWSSGDREVALKMVFMYTLNSKLYNWWDDITLIVWGPSTNLLSTDYELQEYIQKIRENGVKLEACKTCADMYGVTQKLSNLGIDVKFMGIPLTQYIKEGRKIITF
ncbi:MAG: DsrE family protein [Actinobacteria bacterium]|nr:DsrE family protein [Cyanobacteriota bacterium]MCL5771304.1 DsrE family protein [Actinomycetota bacterium]